MRKILALMFAVAACGPPDDTDAQPDTDTGPDPYDGEPVALATTALGGAAMFGGGGLVVADGFVVWSDARGDILRVPIDGGEVTTVVAGQGNVFAVTVSAERIWWTSMAGGLLSTDFDGAEVVEHGGISGPNALAATDEGVVTTAMAGGVYAVSARSAPELISRDDPWSAGVAVAGGDIYWANQGEFPDWEGPIWKLADGESPRVAFAEAQSSPTGVAVHAGYVWWTNRGTTSTPGNLSRAPLAGGAVEVVAAEQAGAAGIAAGGDYVCWTNESMDDVPSGAVRCAPVAGGDPVEIATGDTVASAVACDEEAVYWGDGTNLWRSVLP